MKHAAKLPRTRPRWRAPGLAFRFCLAAAAGLLFVRAPGQTALAPAAPLAGRPAAGAGPALQRLAQAQQDQDLGFPSLAAGAYRELLRGLPAPGLDRSDLVLRLSAALIDGGDIAGAAEALQLEPAAGRESRWHLRAGLVAAYRKNWDEARGEFNLIPDLGAGLPESEKSWWYFLNGMIVEADGDVARAENFYLRAAESATSAYARARFATAGSEAELRRGAVTDAQIEAQRAQSVANAGTAAGFRSRLTYAMMIAARGRTEEAIADLQAQIRALSNLPADRGQLDLYQIVLGLVAPKGVGEIGRNVLYQLLSRPADPERQRAALQVLGGASATGAAREDLRRRLDLLVSGPTPAPDAIRPDLLLFRARMAMQDRQLTPADDDARELLARYPTSPLKAHALVIRAGVSWERKYFRDAAAYAADARREVPAGTPAHASLGLLVAEAYFLSSDYRAAADAYAAAVLAPPPGVPPGDLYFQRILAEIRAADARGEALRTTVVPLLDSLQSNPGFDEASRWQAEWNLARALLGTGQPSIAFARVSGLLAGRAGNPAALPVSLRARMSWLQARLALDTERPEEALQFATGIRAIEGLDPAFRAEILSNAELVRGQALLALNREAEAQATFERIRELYPESGAAVSSLLALASYLEGRDMTVEAERLLIQLASQYPRSEYAPFAILSAASLEQKRGNFREAYNRLNDFVRDYPASDLRLSARLEQGDLAIRMKEYAPAELHFREIIEGTPVSSDHSYIARLRLADVFNLQAPESRSKLAEARDGFDQLAGAVAAPVAVRIEAGYKLGDLLRRSGDEQLAYSVWWNRVVRPYLVETSGVAADATAGGRFFLARSLIGLGEILMAQNRAAEARAMWKQLLDAQLSDEASREAARLLGLDRAAASR